MRTSDMIALADQNGKTYVSKYGTYSKDTGFVPAFSVHESSVGKLFHNLFHEDCWTARVETKKMTKADIEKELGYPIEIDGYEPVLKLNDLEQQAYNRLIKALFD